LIFCACANNVDTDVSADDVESTLQLLLEEAINSSYDQLPGVSASIISPALNEAWSGASGYDSSKKEDTLKIDQPFRIASITKTFVAAAILRLHELDSLSIEDPLSKYTSDEHQIILSSDDYDLNKIKIKHCLNHSSGLFDYAMGGRKYVEISIGQPKKRWTRTEQLQFAVDHGEKLWEPNGGYRYSDTGYILLGEIIGGFYDGDLALGLRTLLKFQDLGLTHTWLETLEDSPIPGVDPVHRYFRRDDLTTYDPSNDLYGGGGLMSTSTDLTKFVSALFEGRIYEKDETLELMLAGHALNPSYDPTTDDRYKDYRYGIWHISLYGKKAFIHSGLWGTHMIYVPEMKTACTVNYTKGSYSRMLKKMILVVKNQMQE